MFDFLNTVLIKAHQEGVAHLEIRGKKQNQKLVVCFINDEYLIDRCNMDNIPLDQWARLSARTIRGALNIMNDLYSQIVRDIKAYSIHYVCA